MGQSRVGAPPSPRASRKFANEMSESSSCGSDTSERLFLNPHPATRQVVCFKKVSSHLHHLSIYTADISLVQESLGFAMSSNSHFKPLAFTWSLSDQLSGRFFQNKIYIIIISLVFAIIIERAFLAQVLVYSKLQFRSQVAKKVLIFAFQIDSDLESETSGVDIKSPTRENGRRSSTSTNNNNPLLSEDAGSTAGSPPKTAVRSNSESQNTPEKKCVTTMSGSNIAWYYQNFRFEFRSNLRTVWDSTQRLWWTRKTWPSSRRQNLRKKQKTK